MQACTATKACLKISNEKASEGMSKGYSCTTQHTVRRTGTTAVQKYRKVSKGTVTKYSCTTQTHRIENWHYRCAKGL